MTLNKTAKKDLRKASNVLLQEQAMQMQEA